MIEKQKNTMLTNPTYGHRKSRHDRYSYLTITLEKSVNLFTFRLTSNHNGLGSWNLPRTKEPLLNLSGKKRHFIELIIRKTKRYSLHQFFIKIFNITQNFKNMFNMKIFQTKNLKTGKHYFLDFNQTLKRISF